MCGICGIISTDYDKLFDRALIEKMTEMIGHRGPDDSGYHLGKGVALGHRRLSIIDLYTGRQPIYNEDRSKCIIFNGEIYNYLEIRDQLIKKGHIFNTKSDTEVILHLYEEVGFECVERLRGMFAFAIWDETERLLFLARDRLGIKPLYYCLKGKTFCFSSEMKSLPFSGIVGNEINDQAIDEYIALNYTMGPGTILRDVKKLQSGHYLVFKNGGIRLAQYWDFNNILETNEAPEKCLEKMEALILECVRMRMMSEVPLGAFLSGGVDSSAIVGLMSSLQSEPVKTFTVGYKGAEEESELTYARAVANHFKTEHHEFILEAKDFIQVVSKVIWHMDEPVAEMATIPLLLLSELAKEHVTVMLSGEGADEIFAGYPIYRYMRQIELFQRIPRRLRDGLLWPLLTRFLRDKKEGKYLEWFSMPLEMRYLGNGSYFTHTMRDLLYTSDFEASLDRATLYDKIESLYRRVRHRDVIGKMLYIDTKTWLPEDLLVKADKMTMAASIELRVPFLDHKLVEFAASLPSRYKATMLDSKHIFKKYAERFVPKDIVYRKKQGFPVPLKQWLKGMLNCEMREILLDSRTRKRGIFNPKYIEKMFERHTLGVEDLSKNIWNLFVLEMWMRIFVDGEHN